MIVTHEIQIDLTRNTGSLCVPVMEGDAYSRVLRIVLNQGRKPWAVPEDVTVVVDYQKPDGTAGIYDTMPDGTDAWAVEEGNLLLKLVPQMLTAAGIVWTRVKLMQEEAVLSVFPFRLVVGESVGTGEESGDYINWRNAFLPQITGAEAGQYLRIGQVDDMGRVVAVESGDIPDGLANYNPTEKTEDMTQPVGVDESGRLWVAPIGGGGAPGIPAWHGIIWDLVHATSSNTAVSVADGASLVAVLSPEDGYALGDVTVTMGGEVLTGVWNAETATVMITNVIGDVVISCAGVEQTGPVDTSPVIVAYDKGLSVYPGTINDFPGVCYTKVYRYEPDIERMKANSAYDPENDYMKSNAIAGVIVHCTPNAKMREAGYSTSGIAASASKVWQYRDDTAVTYYSNTNLSAAAGTVPVEVKLQFTRYNTDIMYSNGVAFTLSTLDAEDSYAYWSDALSAILPIGVRNGDIIFAGKNTPYYGMANIDGTMAGQPSSAELSFDDDIAQNYKTATACVLGDEPVANTETVYGISKALADVITTAKKEWMTEYGGDYRKIPIIVSTDQHGRTNKGIFNLLGKTVSMHDISKVMNLGDTVSEWNDDDTDKPLLSNSGLESWCESVRAIPFSKQLNVFGNHDTWYGNHADEGNPIGTRYPSEQAHLNQYFRNVYARRTNNNGWFAVYDDQFNVKYVVVSAFEYRGNVTFRIGSAQMTWLIDELEKNDGYDVVIVSHVPLYENPEVNIYPTGQTSTTVARVSNLDTDAFFAARKTKGSGTITDSDGVEHSYDFTACESELLCSLHGHTHYDAYLYLNDRLLVNAFDWFEKSTFFFVLIDRVNRLLNVWKVEGDTLSSRNYQIPMDK